MKLRTEDILDVLGTSGQLFTRFSKDRYLSLVDESSWGPLMRVGVNLFSDDQHETITQLAVPPSYEVMESTCNNLFTGGMPLAALPIESLYELWSHAKENPFGRARGLYQAECAFHMRALCEQLGATIPQEFQACPDHLVILLELVALFLEAGNKEAAAQIVQDHLAWLGSYARILAQRAEQAMEIDKYPLAHRKNLEEGILFYRSLTLLIAQVLRSLCQPRVSAYSKTSKQSTTNKMRTREVMHV